MSETGPTIEQQDRPVDAPPRIEAPRALPVRWLRPLLEAPATARRVAGQFERITIEANRVLEKRAIPPLWLSFIALVIAPAFAATVYFAFLASDQFVVETRLAVRSIEAGQDTASKAGDSGFAFTAPYQNAYIVTSYIRSRAVVEDVSLKLKLREIFRRPEADFWARLGRDVSIERLTAYWNGMVETDVDTLSGIVTIKLRAFRRNDALTLANAVIEASEALVNRISERARRDATAMAEKEVRRSFEVVQAALAELNKFRDEFGVINPGQTTIDIVTLLGPLMGQKIKLENDLFVANRELSPEAPTVRVLREQLETANQHITELKAKLTGSGSGATVASTLAKFEELELQRQLAEQFYSLAKSDLDRAVIRSNRQAVYLSVFVPPAMPQISTYPHRLTFPMLAFVALGVIWGIAALILASVEDHRL